MSSSRRRFLKATGTAAGALVLSDPLSEIVKLVAQAPPITRPNMKGATWNTQFVKTYNAGVKAMKALPSTDGRNWFYQANIHGTVDTPVKALWNECQHGSFLFFSWHRMYLWYFERIIRKLTGDQTFGLPFWDWSDSSQRAIPDVLRNPANTTNDLWVQTIDGSHPFPNKGGRTSSVNGGATLPPSAVQFSVAFGYTNFTSPTGSGLSFGGQILSAPQHLGGPHGQLEAQPHDVIHGTLGGWMGYPSFAARDPVFWLHHCNIDRLWNLWLKQGNGRKDPVTNNLWAHHKFSFFDENGVQKQLTGCDILNAQNQLGYVYQGEPLPQVVQSCPTTIIAAPVAVVSKFKELVTNPGGPVELGSGQTLHLDAKPVRKEIKTPAIAGPNAPVAAVSVEGISFDKSPEVYYEVYVGLPKGTAPDPNGPYYVGNLGFFGQDVHEGAQTFKVSRQATEVANRAPAAAGDTLDVTFVPKGLQPAGAAIAAAAPAKPKGHVRIKKVSVVMGSTAEAS